MIVDREKNETVANVNIHSMSAHLLSKFNLHLSTRSWLSTKRTMELKQQKQNKIKPENQILFKAYTVPVTQSAQRHRQQYSTAQNKLTLTGIQTNTAKTKR